jgi:hypothetical protein
LSQQIAEQGVEVRCQRIRSATSRQCHAASLPRYLRRLFVRGGLCRCRAAVLAGAVAPSDGTSVIGSGAGGAFRPKPAKPRPARASIRRVPRSPRHEWRSRRSRWRRNRPTQRPARLRRASRNWRRPSAIGRLGGCGGGLRTPGLGGDGGAGQRRPLSYSGRSAWVGHGPASERMRRTHAPGGRCLGAGGAPMAGAATADAPVIRELERTVDPLFRQARIRLD